MVGRAVLRAAGAAGCVSLDGVQRGAPLACLHLCVNQRAVQLVRLHLSVHRAARLVCLHLGFRRGAVCVVLDSRQIMVEVVDGRDPTHAHAQAHTHVSGRFGRVCETIAIL